MREVWAVLFSKICERTDKQTDTLIAIRFNTAIPQNYFQPITIAAWASDRTWCVACWITTFLTISNFLRFYSSLIASFFRMRLVIQLCSSWALPLTRDLFSVAEFLANISCDIVFTRHVAFCSFIHEIHLLTLPLSHTCVISCSLISHILQLGRSGMDTDRWQLILHRVPKTITF